MNKWILVMVTLLCVLGTQASFANEIEANQETVEFWILDASTK